LVALTYEGLNNDISTNFLKEGQCPEPSICPLSCIRAGTVVSIKELAASVEVAERLREMGFCEEQRIKLISRNGNLICQVCNSRLGISEKLAESIMVSTISYRGIPQPGTV
jgi:Fe2+ transport system protein FeoA